MNENERVQQEAEALKQDHFSEFLELVKESGNSSYKYLQNVYTSRYIRHQNLSVALAVSDMVLGKQGASRVHGGGFAGTIQAFVPENMVEDYREAMEDIFGEGTCQVLKIRKYGGVKVGSILVLGGAGYIGSHTVYELIDAGENVVIVDNLLTGFRKAVHPEAKFYQGDIRDRAFMDSVFEKEDIDGVIHFAASSQVGESMKDPLKYYSNNLCGTEVLLESMVVHGIDKIVFSSTAATYGEPESIPILETDPTVPTNCYGETKLSMEKMFHWTSIAHNLRYVSLRYFNACGAHPNGKIGEAHNPETHLIPLILQVPNHQREYISIFGTDYDTKDGTCVRDYIHVNDLAQAHILAMNYLRNGGKSDIFNLGNGVGFTVKEVVETAREVTGHPIPAKEEARRAGDPSTLIASSGRAKSILGWKPQYADLRVIIETAWKWHQAHPHGYKAD